MNSAAAHAPSRSRSAFRIRFRSCIRLMRRTTAHWAWHDRPRPGVLHHVAKSGDEIWTVRAGTQRQMDVFTIRKLCDIADQFAEGHVRFTTRSQHRVHGRRPDKVAAADRRR